MRKWRRLPIAGQPRVGLAVACYMGGSDTARRQAQLACLCYAIRAQTWENWEILVTHDGEDHADKARAVVESVGDARISVWATPEREGRYGHRWRREAALRTSGDVLGMANDDGWYAPVYFEALLASVTAGAPLAFCDCVHSHRRWRPLRTEAKRGRIDVGGWLARREIVEKAQWKEVGFDGDGAFVDAMVAAARPRSPAKIDYTLYVHN